MGRSEGSPVCLCDICGRTIAELGRRAVECEELGKTEKAWWHPYEGNLPSDVCPAFFERPDGRCPVCGGPLCWASTAHRAPRLQISRCRGCGGQGRLEDSRGRVTVVCDGCGARGGEYLSAKGGRRMAITDWNRLNEGGEWEVA